MKSITKYPISKSLAAILLASLLILAVGVSTAQAQSPIYAEVDRASLTTDDTLTLKVTIASSLMNTPRPSLPNLQGFDLLGSSTASQISLINGEVSSQVVYSYRLMPREAGDLVIDPITVTINGQSYSTGPIPVRVIQGSGAAPSGAAAPAAAPSDRQQTTAPEDFTGQDLFVEAVVDNPTPYVGQQVVHTFRFYSAINLLGQSSYEAPTFTGFWSEGQSEQAEYRAQGAGRIYEVTELRTILFPTAAGPVTIDPARLSTAGGFFSRGQTLQTKPVELNVQALPSGAPEGFDGAVGQFSLQAAVDTTQGLVNEPLTWHVTLSGRGNLTAAPDPSWPELPGWRDFESEATIHTETREGQVVGTRTYERLLVPAAEGEFTIPALEYAYFDPEVGQYQVVRTEPIPVSIAPGTAPTTSEPLPASNATKETVEQHATDIRHLKAVPSELGTDDAPLTRSGLYWAAWVFPLFGAAGYFVWQQRQRYWENNLGLVRSSRARKKAKKALSRARRQKDDAYGTAGQILTAYLADKLDRPVAGLTHQALAELLSQQGVGPDLIERIQVILTTSELGRFAPGADDPGYADSLLKEASGLIDTLEKAL
jgi:hypothetical protein